MVMTMMKRQRGLIARKKGPQGKDDDDDDDGDDDGGSSKRGRERIAAHILRLWLTPAPALQASPWPLPNVPALHGLV